MAEGGKPVKWLAAGVVLFLLAILLGRLLVAGGAAWAGLFVVVPLLLFGFSAAVGFRFALVATAVFVVIVLAVRWLLDSNPLGWIGLALLPIVVLSAAIAGRVLGALRKPKEPAAAPDPPAEP